jgi:hypothetical protein
MPFPVTVPLNFGGADNVGYDGSPGSARGADIVAGDTIYFRPCGGAFDIDFLGLDGQWYDDGAGPTADTLDVGVGFWLRRGTNAGAGVTWTQPKPYANPPN